MLLFSPYPGNPHDRMQMRMRQIKRIEMVDAWTQTSNRGSDNEDKNRVHEGKIMVPTKLKNL